MAQEIKNIKAGQRFLVVDENVNGFERGCIIEALGNSSKFNTDICDMNFKWIGGKVSEYADKRFKQSIKDLKRFRGKLDYGTSNN